MGELRQRGRIWWVRYYRGGRRHEESSGSDKKGVAIDLLRLREGDIAKGVPVSAAIARLRFDDAVEDVINDYKVNGRRSLRDVEQRVRDHLLPAFGGRKMATVTTDQIRAYSVQRRDEGAANASISEGQSGDSGRDPGGVPGSSPGENDRIAEEKCRGRESNPHEGLALRGF
jgi:hypothetical protein